MNHLGTVRDWFAYAPPKMGKKHWKSGRSAIEMAKAWRFGRIPSEISDAFGGTPFSRFDPEEAFVEFVSRFDDAGGESRNHDLVIFGSIDGTSAIVDIEGKADEPFGAGSVRDVFTTGSAGQQQRVTALCAAMFGRRPDDPDIGPLRYQLVYGVFATAQLAANENRSARALFLVQTFENETCSRAKLARNTADLNAFLRRLNNPAVTASRPVIGPVSEVPGCEWIPRGCELWVGKVDVWQADSGP